MNKVISFIQNAPQIQTELRQQFKDKNIIFKIYDRNKCMRTRWATCNGKAIGTCQQESEQQLPFLYFNGFKPKLYIAQIYLPVINKFIWHQYIVIRINGKRYFESKSNGLHKRVPLYVWKQNNDVRINREVEVEIRLES